MKVLVVNGSPKGAKSNTMNLTNAVIEGLRSEDPNAEVKILTVKNLDIKPCLGCMSCWGATAGKCVIDDVMQEIHREFMLSDVIIYSFPLFFFGMPGPMKTFLDRIMPLMETYTGAVKTIGDAAFHEFRYDVSDKRFLVVSSCGYGKTEEIYDSLIKEFNFVYGTGKYNMLLTPQSEMFAIPPLRPQIEVYLDRYRVIGTALAKGEEITEEMTAKCAEPILPQRAFETLVNNYWSSVTPENPLPAPHLRDA